VRPFERGAAGAGWLLAGLIAGSLVTAGLVLGGVRFVRQGIPTEAAEPPRFVEQTATTGVEHVYDGEFNFFVGGGVGGPTSTSPAAPVRRRFLATKARSAENCASGVSKALPPTWIR
jgi:hypothetical protein